MKGRIDLENMILKKLPPLFGMFAELWRASIDFVLSVQMEQLGSHWMDFPEICIFENCGFIKIKLHTFCGQQLFFENHAIYEKKYNIF